jgi:uncharacterized protein (DUF2141 family)
MKRFLITNGAFSAGIRMFFLIFLLLIPSGLSAAVNGDIILRIKNLKYKKGKILVALFQSPEGFPGDDKQSVKSWVLEPGKEFVLQDIPPGRYALSVLHDTDGNLRMSSNILGIPKEGFGFSGREPSFLSFPDFKKSAFDHPAGGTVLEINLHY